VESLAALAAWVGHYDSGEWDDPPGKRALLYDLERVAHLPKDGREPFHPDRDRLAFARFLVEPAVSRHRTPSGPLNEASADRKAVTPT
jgi:hypothetical protein